ncbi:hypothetical protein BS47DRAFT_396668 [Hydnum rufescens UP504]|uniref:Uncharacterized protein n=1 Tax=Hydnum rufescens UP504 TaxID=1448309 RepID=A0A9P6AKL5_9AGAM|nr:hypothetical protein BS47DRAFT_396668 [Hydnum rufescens UP504]
MEGFPPRVPLAGTARPDDDEPTNSKQSGTKAWEVSAPSLRTSPSEVRSGHTELQEARNGLAQTGNYGTHCNGWPAAAGSRTARLIDFPTPMLRRIRTRCLSMAENRMGHGVQFSKEARSVGQEVPSVSRDPPDSAADSFRQRVLVVYWDAMTRKRASFVVAHHACLQKCVMHK